MKRTKLLSLAILASLLLLWGCDEDSKTSYVPVTQSGGAEAEDEGLNWQNYKLPIVTTTGEELTMPKLAFAADGRMLLAEGDYMNSAPYEIAIETSAGSGQFKTILNTSSTTGCFAFVVSEDASHVIVADSSKIFRVAYDGTVTELASVTYTYKAKVNGGYLYYTYMGGLSRLNLTTKATEPLINIPGGSADLIVTASHIYAAPGSGKEAGLIKRFANPASGAAAVEFSSGTDYYQAESAGSLEILGDYLLIGDLVMDSSWNTLDNVCTAVLFGETAKAVFEFDPITTSTSDSYEIAVGGGRVGLSNTTWNGGRPETQTINVTAADDLAAQLDGFRF